VAEHTSAVEPLGLIVASRPGVSLDEVSMWGRDLGPVLSSPVDIVVISGTAVGGTTALARAGYGQTIMASTSGPAIRVCDSTSDPRRRTRRRRGSLCRSLNSPLY
jgi:hypothetical protein